MSLTFLNTDTRTILAEIKDAFEKASGRVLYPAQVENLLLHTLAYREALLRQDIQHCAEQNLVAYAIGEHLDELGRNLETPRLRPTAAETYVRFTLADSAPEGGRQFPIGARVTTEDGKVAFETLEVAYVLSGANKSTAVRARCTAPGTLGNGLDGEDLEGNPGAVCCLDPKQPGVSATNTEGTDGGSDLETDEAYRERLMMSMSRFGGGTRSAYRLWAMTASALVSDALAVAGPDGTIEIYIHSPSSPDGVASEPLCALVEGYCNRDDVCLVNDIVRVYPATSCDYEIRATVAVSADHDPTIVMDRVRALANEFALSRAARLGANVTRTQVLMALSPERDGLYEVDLDLIVDGVETAVVEVDERRFAKATRVDIVLAGGGNG